MPDIPIFDSLTHPTPNGCWLESRWDDKATALALREAMKRNNVTRALAVGMGTEIGGYSEETYADFVRDEIPSALPIAFCDFLQGTTQSKIEKRIERIASLGYRGLKIHPRFSFIDYTHPNLVAVIRTAHKYSLPTLLCTYNYQKERARRGNGLDDLSILFSRIGEAKLILLHGGVFSILELGEIIRPYPNLLLDMSFTFCRFAGSSLDFDIAYLFENFDQRICVGSDHPEISLEQLRHRFDFFTKNLSPEKAENVGNRNLAALFDPSEK